MCQTFLELPNSTDAGLSRPSTTRVIGEASLRAGTTVAMRTEEREAEALSRAGRPVYALAASPNPCRSRWSSFLVDNSFPITSRLRNETYAILTEFLQNA